MSSETLSSAQEEHFEQFRQRIPGRRDSILTPYGTPRKLYADTTASGQPDAVIEERVMEMKRHYANTHTTSNHTGDLTTRRYHFAGTVLREHVNAGDDDVLIAAGSGMTEVANKLVRMMGLSLSERFKNQIAIPEQERPVVFITHMEHHSNILPWRESIAEVVTVPPDKKGLPDPVALTELCKRYAGRPLIGSFTAASNVTGVRSPYREMARVMHENGGKCIVDFAASAPYDPIDMHPENDAERLDAILFSPHKFQGGIEAPGVLVLHKSLLNEDVPDRKGGGTVDAVDPWGGHWYGDNIESREDGGTPPIIGRMRAAFAIRLKEAMGMEQIAAREHQLVDRFMDGLKTIDGITVFEAHNRNRIGIVSLAMADVPHGLLTRLLNDRFGIQVRNGCSCAGPYGHYLLDIGREESAAAIRRIVEEGDESAKPGWVRVSLHPTMTDAEVDEILNALRAIRVNALEWRQDYEQVELSSDFIYVKGDRNPDIDMEREFDVMRP